MAERFDRLTERQKECLRLYHARFDTKSIARQLGLSDRAVEEHFAAARRHLGVNRSLEAARLLWEHEEGHSGRSTPQPSTVVPVTSDMPSEQPSERHGLVPLPFPTRERPRNDLTFAQKLAYALLLAALLALVFGGAAAALSGLSEIL